LGGLWLKTTLGKNVSKPHINKKARYGGCTPVIPATKVGFGEAKVGNTV
jgi:hypothetical protein